MQRKAQENENVVYVGRKPLMVYVQSALSSISTYGSVVFMARGASMSHAIDCYEVLKNRFGQPEGIIETDTEVIHERNVSVIKITVEGSSK